MYLYHYYDRTVGPFRSLTELPLKEARAVLEGIRREKPNSQSAGRDELYVEHRLHCENILREAFAKKGGIIERGQPYYLVVEHSP